MNLTFKGAGVADAVEKLKQKYLENRKQCLLSEDNTSGASDEAVKMTLLANRSKDPSNELKCYNKAIHELFKAVTNHPEQFGSDQDLSGDSPATPLQDSQGLFTETDVTLPSCLEGSPGSPETEFQRAPLLPDSGRSSSLVLITAYQEMMTIYKQLKTEHQNQQRWEKELHERERRLKQQEEGFGRLAGLEEMLHARILAVEEKHQQEVGQLQDLLRERGKENRRLKSSFDTIKELNDNMKKQLNEISEQNKKLEIQSKRVQARLENLQRKYEHGVASRVCVKTSDMKPSKKEKAAAAGQTGNKGSSSPTPLQLLALLMDWILDGQTFTSDAGRKVAHPCLPPEILLNERCLKVLPLLADQLHHTPSSEPELLLNTLRLIHWALRRMDSSMQHVARSATLRRIGEEVSRPPAHIMVPQSEDPDLLKSRCGAAGKACRTWPLYRSPCTHTRILSTLIILRTVTQADVLARALDSLHTELLAEESRGLFIHHGGVPALLSMLRAGRGGLNTPVDILMRLAEQSCYLNPFLDACSCEEFFQTASQLLKTPSLEFSSLEKLSILLQKLSRIRKNRRLFEMSSLHLQIQELNHKTSHAHTFLCLNLSSILLNLESHTSISLPLAGFSFKHQTSQSK